jgi:ABC-2 type transport system permease protein
MLYPRALLPHVLVSRMSTTAWGDMSFGYVVYLLFIRPDLAHLLMFVMLTLSVAILFVGFSIFTGSLGFYLGNSAELSNQWFNATIHFSTYPGIIFDGLVRVLLYTLIPAGFISYLPIEALRQLSLGHAALSLLGSGCILSLGVILFYRGLKRYESGNLMEMRG